MSEQVQNRPQEQQNPEAIERDIERTRMEMDRTLDDLTDRLSVGRMVDMGVDNLRHGAGADFMESLGQSVRRNPWPVVITAIGLGWLMVSASRSRTPLPTGRVPVRTAPVPVTEPVVTERPGVGKAVHGSASIDYGEEQAQAAHAEGMASIEYGRRQAQAPSPPPA